MCGIFHKRQENKNSCETIIHDLLITAQVTWTVTNQFIISLGDRDVHLSTARWGGCSRVLGTGTHLQDGTVLTPQLLCEPHLSSEKLPVFGRGVPASLGCVLSGEQFQPLGNFLGKELPLKLSSHKCQEMVCSPTWIMVSGQLIHGHKSSIRQLMVS